ncbi:MAG: hypothetical protein WCQ99_08275, partial [Pseudomonadota bacterium]
MKRQFGNYGSAMLCGAMLMLMAFTVPLKPALAADVPGGIGPCRLYDRFSAQGGHLTLPIYQVGIELITEGTNNYIVERKMRNIFPLDLDLTVFLVWGYTGDKINIKITDKGDKGDRIFGVALNTYGGKPVPAWGTLYSSDTQDSFE